jgi:dTDP-4-amino-4,6-dideoxygalactose transaminase
MRIPLSAPDVNEEDIKAVSDVLRTSRLSLGPKLEEFEHAIAAYVGASDAVAVNSGTSALHLCLGALGNYSFICFRCCRKRSSPRTGNPGLRRYRIGDA